SHDQFYCIDSSRIADRNLISAIQADELSKKGSLAWKDEQVPVFRLRELLAQPTEANVDKQTGLIVWQNADGLSPLAKRSHTYALLVDGVIGQQETLVRTLGRHAICWPGVAGAAELLDGKVALMLDIEQLIDRQV